MNDDRPRSDSEDELALDAKLWDSILTFVPDIVIVVSADHRIRYVNRVVPPFRVEDAIGARPYDFIAAEGHESYRAALEQVFATGAVVEHEVFGAGRHGEPSWYLSKMGPLIEEGKVVAVIVASTDITERKKAEFALKRANEELERRVEERTRELRKANESLKEEMIERLRSMRERERLQVRMQQTQKLESLGVMAGGIAHDFNNLLVSILGNASLASTAVAPESAVATKLEQIEIAARRAAELTRQLLTYTGRGQILKHAIDLAELVDEMGHLLETVVSKRVQIDFDFAPIDRILGDPSQVRQVAMNLITNAAEAIGDPGGKVHLRLRQTTFSEKDERPRVIEGEMPPGRYVVLEVQDDGHGMDTDTLHRIFDPFFTTKFTGRGLGLAAVLGIVRSHDAYLEVDSQPGEGTRFRVFFPSVRGADAFAPHEIELPQEFRGSGVVLVVDDEPGVRQVGGEILEQLGFEVAPAIDGAEAVQILRVKRGAIVLALLDLTMPIAGGFDTWRALRHLRPHLPILLSSGYSEQALTPDQRRDPLTEFLQKPYDREGLAQKVRQLLSQPSER